MQHQFSEAEHRRRAAERRTIGNASAASLDHWIIGQSGVPKGTLGGIDSHAGNLPHGSRLLARIAICYRKADDWRSQARIDPVISFPILHVADGCLATLQPGSNRWPIVAQRRDPTN